MYFVLVVHFTQAKQWVSNNGAAPNNPKITLLNSTLNASVVQVKFSGFYKEKVPNQANDIYTVSSPELTPLLSAGNPDLLKYTTSLIIPDQGEMKVEVISSNYIEYTGIELAPSKGNLYRDVNPSTVPFRVGSTYEKSEFWPANIAELRAPYILRDLRGQTVVITPFQYNPITKVLRFYTDITVNVSKMEGSVGENEFHRSKPLTKVDKEFYAIYQKQFLNASVVQYVPLEEDGNLLIIAYDYWVNQVQPLANWKKKKGIPTAVVSVSTAGTNATAIQNFIANYYNTNGLTHVLLVGDVTQVPTFISPANFASDPSYGFIQGFDSYAEVFVGRMSAESLLDVMTQVERTLNYEINPDTTQWLNQGVVVASNQGPGDDNEMDWEHATAMRDDLLGYTYNQVSELYDGTQSTTTDAPGDPSNIDLFNLFQSGIGIMTYTGHGSSTSCGTTGLSNSDIDNMTNENRLPFIWSVACVNGDFTMTNGPCFAEKFLRTRSNGKPVGAIATFMSSINQSWNPPMDAQDEMVDILTEQYASNIKRTFAGLSVNGCMHMNDQYGGQGDEMTQSWHTFGDPTLNVRTATPQVMSATHPLTIPTGSASVIINGSFNGGYVCLSMNHAIWATGTIVNGAANLSFSPLNTVDTLYVTITGINQIPYQGYILILPASGPYMTYETHECRDLTGNLDSLVDFNELATMDISLSNLGVVDAQNVSVVLSTADTNITVIDDSIFVSVLNPSAIQLFSNAFKFQVANNIPDQHNVVFILTMTDLNGNSWTSTFSQRINAPALQIGQLIIDDSISGDNDGYLEPGESATIRITCNNIGHSNTNAAFGHLTTLSPNVNIFTNLSGLNIISKQGSKTANFNVSMNSNVAIGSSYILNLNLWSGAYSTNQDFARSAGIILEDFETGNFSRYNWQFAGNSNWNVTTVNPFQGADCAQSGNINDNESSQLTININSIAFDTLSFWYKVSSEQSWDFLRLFIDGIPSYEWSGTIPWSYHSLILSPGQHQITFSYEKDAVYSVGADCAWLDNIRLPMGAVTTSLETISKSEGINAYPNPVNDVLTLEFGSKISGNTTVSIYTLDGRLVHSVDVDNYQTQNKIQVNTTQFNSGMYMVQVRSRDFVKVSKVNIQH